MQFAAARNFEHVGVGGFDHAQRDVAHHFALQALAQLAAGHELAFAPGERRGVDLEIHGQRRLVDFQQRQRFGMLGIGDGDADADFLDAVDEHDVAGQRFIGHHALEALEYLHLIDLWR